jgi:protocatechuate 3,4-dioxygenase beta subunit
MNRLLIVAALASLAAPIVSGQDPSKTSEPTKHFKQQRPPAAFILGRIVDAVSNQPVAGAKVTLANRGGARGQSTSASVLATDAGYFLFRDVAAGSYTIAAVAPAYLPGGYGQSRLGGPSQPFTIADAERANVTIRLWREASLSGTIADETGDPVAGIAVTLIAPEQLAGAANRVPTSPFRMFSELTDASGAYHFTALLPGEYIVAVPTRMSQLPLGYANADQQALEVLRTSGFAGLTSGVRSLGAMVRVGDVLVQTSEEGTWGGSNALARKLPTTIRADGTVVAYPPTFFPGTSNPSQAATIKLASGDDRRDVNLRLAPIALGRVTGRLNGPAGPMPGMTVHLIPAWAIDSGLERTQELGVTVSLADGTFSFVAVPPGEYVIKSWRLPQSGVLGAEPFPAESTLWARVPITVTEKHLTGVSVQLQTGSFVKGRIVFDGAPQANLAGRLQTVLSVAFEPTWSLAFGARLATRISPAFEFTTQGLPPGRYAPVLPNQFLSAATGWFFESVTRDGRDLMLSPLVIEPATDVTDVVISLSDKRTTVAGTVSDASGRPHTSAAVVIFPADIRTWIEGGLPALAAFSGPASQSGSFSLDVRPGEYFIAAIDEARLADWHREAVIRALAAQATRVKFMRGDNPRQELRVIAIRNP